MELYQLRSFVAVAEHGHLTRASERLHISQPALSAQIRALEEELETELFARVPGGMSLTAAGEALLVEARRVLGAAQSLRNAARALKGEVVGHLRLGMLADPEFLRLSDFLALAVERYPRVAVELHHEVSGTAFEKVRDGSLDASYYYGDRTDPAVASIPLRGLAFRVVGPAAWRDRVEHGAWETIAALPWIMTPPISTHHALATAFFNSHGVAPTTLIEADNETVIAFLVASGLGVALMREDLALNAVQAGDVCLWDGVRMPTTLQFLYLRERGKDPEIAAVLDVLRDVWPGERERAA
jgi:DNA-binding transcriptional LysR family regulator